MKKKIAAAAMLIGTFAMTVSVQAAEIDPSAIVGETSKEVSAQTMNQENKSFLVNVGWGDMEFVYDYGEKQWDASQLTYVGEAEKGWHAQDIDGENNKVVVTNQSNARVQVKLQFKMEENVFNESVTSDSVVGFFYDTNENAIKASKILTGTDSATFEGKVDILILETAAPYEYTTKDGENKDVVTQVEAGIRSAAAYFAFSGTPDKALVDNASVGSIYVVFSEP